MKLDALRHGNFASLDEAVRDWSRVVTQLRTLEREARDGMCARAERANWEGAASEISRAFVTKTAGEFADAATQATSIRNILSDVRGELASKRDELNRAIERGRAKDLLVVGTAGGGFEVKSVAPCDATAGTGTGTSSGAGSGAGAGKGSAADAKVVAAAEAAAALQRERIVNREIHALRDELQRILNAATESDTTADRVLRTLVAQAERGFSSGPAYRDRDTAAAALRSADSMAALMKKGHLSEPELASLKAGLKKYASDPLFAEQFAVRSGARGTLDFWADRARFEKDHELQKYLGLTLAEATRSDSPQMRAWERGMVDLGDESISAGRREAKGFQVMSNLMRWGQYDNEFLKGYGAELIRVEKELGENGRASAEDIWGDSLPLNRSRTDAGHDPMTGFMQALSKSPDAATAFFNGTFVTEKEDHEFFVDPENEDKGKKGLSNFDYLFSERDWPVTHHPGGEESFAGPEFMASALEAAATGRMAGEAPGPHSLPHTAEQAKIMSAVVTAVSESEERLTHRKYLGDNLGRIAADYLPDINRTLVGPSLGESAKLFPLIGTQAEITKNDLMRFLVTMGQTREGNAALEYGHKAYMASLMDYHLNPNLSSELRHSSDSSDTLSKVSFRAGEIGGALTIGRQEAALIGPTEEDKAFSNEVSQGKNTWAGLVGAGVGVGVSFIGTPVLGAVAGGAATTVGSMAIEYVSQQAEAETTRKTFRSVGEIWEEQQASIMIASQNSVLKLGEAHEYSDSVALANTAGSSAQAGFTAASANFERMSKDLETDVHR
ncbi:hypothetical protein ACFYVL_17025 [Streptomyces sp. NPDC004111]|uniref:hypothetical protein n=1 Tax=Streptomyces sp. NPDC004111 TaxID=3364690 RepID=UPI00367A9B88